MIPPRQAPPPRSVPAQVDAGDCRSLVSLLDRSFERHATQPAFRFLGRDIRYERIDHLSRSLAAWLQQQGLERGDRVAVMLSNVPQVAVAVAAILRAGLVVVNVDPLLTPRALEHQLRDAGARAIVILENVAHTLQQVLPQLPLRSIVVAATGDLLGPVKGAVVNYLTRRVRRLVPPFDLPRAVPFVDAIAHGRSLVCTESDPGPDDIALLQYTGGTTGISRGAVLLHRNLVANLLQCEAWYGPALRRVPAGEQLVLACAMPLHHLFGFSIGLMLGMHLGGCHVLIPNPRDIADLLGTLEGEKLHGLSAANTVFPALVAHPHFERVDWSSLVLAVSGGMAVHPAAAQAWAQRTGCPICETYGLTEASPVASCNRLDATGSPEAGGIGRPLPGTDMKIVDDDGRELPPGEPGEIVIRGPQVMAGYWQRPDETSRAMTADGFLRSGDIGVMDDGGRFRLVDRKQDMLVVGGHKVSPTEIEDIVASMPGVLDVAAVGTRDPRGGEGIKVVVVRKDTSIAEAQVRAFAEARLPGHKRPQLIEFRDALPRTPQGKVLRRELRG